MIKENININISRHTAGAFSFHIQTYYKAVCEAYGAGNIETSYNAPIMALLTEFGCKARDMSGGRGGQAGENIDIKLWRSDEPVRLLGGNHR